VIKLGLFERSEPPEAFPETEIPPLTPPAAPPPLPPDRASALDTAIRELELSSPDSAPASSFKVPELADSTLPEHVPEAVEYWLARYARNPLEAARNIRELFARAPDLTVETILALHQTGAWGGAAPFLAGLLTRSERTIEKLCDPASGEDAIQLAQTLARQEPRFDAHFAKTLLVDDRMDEESLRRGLVILEKLGSGGRLVPILIQFLRSPDGRIRSLAALMLGRINPTRSLSHRLMRDEDPRVRANFVEGLWNPSAEHRILFRQALQDPNPSVVGNALVGLHRAGEGRDVISHVAGMARHPDPHLRSTAAWVMGKTGDCRFAAVLGHMVNDPDSGVRRQAEASLRQLQAPAANSNGSSHSQPSSGPPPY
jgi:hypothetical protein